MMGTVFVDTDRRRTLVVPTGNTLTHVNLMPGKVNEVPSDLWAAARKVRASGSSETVIETLERMNQIREIDPAAVQAMASGQRGMLADRRILTPLEAAAIELGQQGRPSPAAFQPAIQTMPMPPLSAPTVRTQAGLPPAEERAVGPAEPPPGTEAAIAKAAAAAAAALTAQADPEKTAAQRAQARAGKPT